jgi:uncharacterized membrane protein YphA (DoxX/SURF4 family)
MFTILMVGRVILGAYFIYSGYSHFSGLKGMTGYAASKKVPFPKLAVIGTGIMLLVGGLSILTGFFATLGIILLVLFLLPTTILMHNFWKETDPSARMNQKIAFNKNFGIIGALLIIIGMMM